MIGNVTMPKWFLICVAIGFGCIALIKLVTLYKYCLQKRKNKNKIQLNQAENDLERNRYLEQRLSVITLSDDKIENKPYDRQSVAYDIESLANVFDDPTIAIKNNTLKLCHREGRTFSWGKRNRDQQYTNMIYNSYLLATTETPAEPVHSTKDEQKY